MDGAGGGGDRSARNISALAAGAGDAPSSAESSRDLAAASAGAGDGAVSRGGEGAGGAKADVAGREDFGGSFVCLLGFHHKEGHMVEWHYPPLAHAKWSHLAFLALPEGAHKTDGLGFVYFTIELATEGQSTHHMYYGVAMFGQIKTEDLLVSEKDATRNHVQKSCAFLCKDPCFGYMHAILQPAVESFFNQRDFTRREVLVDALRRLAVGGEQLMLSISCHDGISPVPLVRVFGRKLMLLYKFLLLEPRMVFFATRCEDVSRIVLSLASLVPELIPSMSPAFQLDQAHATDPAGGAHSSGAVPHDASQPSGRGRQRVPSLVGLQGSFKVGKHSKEATQHGLPLHVLHRKCKLEPYLTMEVLMLGDRKEGGILCGTSNAWLCENPPKGLLHVLANCETGSISVFQEKLKKLGVLSAHERAFMDEVESKVEHRIALTEQESGGDSMWGGGGTLSDGEGTATWVRGKFREYTLRLLQAAARHEQLPLISSEIVNKEVLENELPRMYGSSWVQAWRETRSYSRWAAEHDLSIAHISRPPQSPAVLGAVKDGVQGGFLDLRNSMRHTVGAKGGIRSALKSRFSSLFGSSPQTSPNTSLSPSTKQTLEFGSVKSSPISPGKPMVSRSLSSSPRRRPESCDRSPGPRKLRVRSLRRIATESEAASCAAQEVTGSQCATSESDEEEGPKVMKARQVSKSKARRSSAPLAGFAEYQRRLSQTRSPQKPLLGLAELTQKMPQILRDPPQVTSLEGPKSDPGMATLAMIGKSSTM